MSTSMYSVTLTFFMCICASDTFAKTGEPITTYKDAYINFRYPANLYKKINRPDTDISGAKMRFYNLERRNGDVSDVITICNATVNVCANIESQTSPYWIDGDTKQLALYDTTVPVAHMEKKDGDVYEAFPLCPAADETGKSSSYGADCYVAVKFDGQNTVSLTYWLGSNADARTRRSKLDAVRRARKILESISKPK
jgi:hypothetical protein